MLSWNYFTCLLLYMYPASNGELIQMLGNFVRHIEYNWFKIYYEYPVITSKNYLVPYSI